MALDDPSAAQAGSIIGSTRHRSWFCFLGSWDIILGMLVLFTDLDLDPALTGLNVSEPAPISFVTYLKGTSENKILP